MVNYPHNKPIKKLKIERKLPMQSLNELFLLNNLKHVF